MSSQGTLPNSLQAVLKEEMLRRLPMTFLPFVNQQVREWEFSFPYEQRYLVRILQYVSKLDGDRFDALFRGVRDMETRMDISRSNFSTSVQTIENAAILARSPYYQEWRNEVRKVFEQIERATAPRDADSARRRLILLIFPARLPFDPKTIWARWRGMGREMAIKLPAAGTGQPMLDALFGPSTFLTGSTGKRDRTADDLWVIEAGTEISSRLEQLRDRAEGVRATCLSFQRLKLFRERFLEQINAIQRDLTDADAVFGRLRDTDVDALCPPEIATRPEVREFVRSVFLSGNGALVFSNAFVEWAASEAFRRARPAIVVAHMGTRAVPKPFTSVAVFENQERANPLPEREDLAGSALDAQVMAHYIGLATRRFPEYQRAACVCLAEAVPSAYVIAPPDFGLLPESEPIPFERIPALLTEWLT